MDTLWHSYMYMFLIQDDTELVLHQQRDFLNQNVTAMVGTFFHARPAWSFSLKSSSLFVVVIPLTGSSISLPGFLALRLDNCLLRGRLLSPGHLVGSCYAHPILRQTFLMMADQQVQVILKEVSLVFRGTSASLPLDPWITLPFFMALSHWQLKQWLAAIV